MSRAQKSSPTRRGCVEKIPGTTVSKPKVVSIPTYNICSNLAVGPQLLRADQKNITRQALSLINQLSRYSDKYDSAEGTDLSQQ